MKANIMIAGVGGQGTVLASKLIAQAAMARGLHIRTTETIGMAQRGGSVVSHVRIGGDIQSPLISRGEADTVLAFEPAEALRLLPYLSENGGAVVCDTAVHPTTGAYDLPAVLEYLKRRVGRLRLIDGGLLLRELGTPKVLNTALLGAAAVCGALPFSAEELADAIRTLLPTRFWDINLHAVQAGGDYCHDE
jgi:indolepyruvate ferredoxin oxidoreductase beta subunit